MDVSSVWKDTFSILPDTQQFRKGLLTTRKQRRPTAGDRHDSIKATGTALITGASTGIGAIYADRLAKRGYDLILVARNKERLASLARRLANETGRNVETVEADLTSPADLRRVEDILRTDTRHHPAGQQRRRRRHRTAASPPMSTRWTT